VSSSICPIPLALYVIHYHHIISTISLPTGAILSAKVVAVWKPLELAYCVLFGVARP